jgi:thiol-disulfide isomerase/thioredoxin
MFVNSQTARLSGTANDYLGDSIIIYKYKDLITYDKEILNVLYVDSSGTFSVDLQVNEITYIFMYLGIFRAEMYVEPNIDYVIKFPPLVEKETQDLLNPYFKYVNTLIGIESPDNEKLNVYIRNFDNIYSKYVNKNFQKIYRNVEKTDSFRLFIKKNFSDYDNKFFQSYVYYQLVELNYLGPARNYKAITEYFYKNKPILYNNQPYMQLFNNMYKDFFAYYPFERKGEQLSEDIILAKSIKKLKETLSKEIAFDDEDIQELIILKGLHDAFLGNVPKSFTHYPKAQLYQTLDSLMILTNIDKHKEIGRNIVDKYNVKGKIIAGALIPDITLLNYDSVEVKLRDFKGKYVYLNITMTNCVPCQKDLEIIQSFSKKYALDIEFVTIILNGNIGEMKQFMIDNKYYWNFLHYGYDEDLRNIFKADVIPKYILIDPFNRIVLPSAPPPGDKFTVVFRKVLNSAR